MTSEGHYAGTQPAEATSGGPTSDGFPPDSDGQRISGRALPPPPADGFPSSYAPPPPATPNGGSPFVVPAVPTFSQGAAGPRPSGTPYGSAREPEGLPQRGDSGPAHSGPTHSGPAQDGNGSLPQRGSASPYGSVSPFAASSASSSDEPPQQSAWAPAPAPRATDPSDNPFGRPQSGLPQRTPADAPPLPQRNPTTPPELVEFNGFAAGNPGRGDAEPSTGRPPGISAFGDQRVRVPGATLTGLPDAPPAGTPSFNTPQPSTPSLSTPSLSTPSPGLPPLSAPSRDDESSPARDESPASGGFPLRGGGSGTFLTRRGDSGGFPLRAQAGNEADTAPKAPEDLPIRTQQSYPPFGDGSSSSASSPSPSPSPEDAPHPYARDEHPFGRAALDEQQAASGPGAGDPFGRRGAEAPSYGSGPAAQPFGAPQPFAAQQPSDGAQPNPFGAPAPSGPSSSGSEPFPGAQRPSFDAPNGSEPFPGAARPAYGTPSPSAAEPFPGAQQSVFGTPESPVGSAQPNPYGRPESLSSDDRPFGRPETPSFGGSDYGRSFEGQQPPSSDEPFRRPDNPNSYPQRVPGAALSGLPGSAAPYDSSNGSVPQPRDPESAAPSSASAPPVVGSARPVAGSASVPTASRVAPVDPSEIPPQTAAPQARVYGRPAPAEPEDEEGDSAPQRDEPSSPFSSPGTYGASAFAGNGPGSEPANERSGAYGSPAFPSTPDKDDDGPAFPPPTATYGSAIAPPSGEPSVYGSPAARTYGSAPEQDSSPGAYGSPAFPGPRDGSPVFGRPQSDEPGGPFGSPVAKDGDRPASGTYGSASVSAPAAADQESPGPFSAPPFPAPQDSPYGARPEEQRSPYGARPSDQESLYGTRPAEGDQQPNVYGSRPAEDSPFGARPSESPFGARPGDAPFGGRPGEAPFGAQSGEGPSGTQPGEAPFGAQAGDTPFGARPGDAPFGAQAGDAPFGARPGDAPFGARPGDAPFGARPGEQDGPFGARPGQDGARPGDQNGSNPFGARPAQQDSPFAPPAFGSPQQGGNGDNPYGAPAFPGDEQGGSGAFGSPAQPGNGPTSFGAPAYPNSEQNGTGTPPVAPQSPARATARASASARVSPPGASPQPASGAPSGSPYGAAEQFSELTTDIAGREQQQYVPAPALPTFPPQPGQQPFPGQQSQPFGGQQFPSPDSEWPSSGPASRATVTPPNPEDTTSWPGVEAGQDKFDQFKALPEPETPPKPETPHVRMLPILIAVVVGAGLLVGLAFGIVYLVAGHSGNSTSTSSSISVNTGDCVKKSGTAAVKATCTDAGSYKVTSIVDDKSKCSDPQQPYVVNPTSDGKTQVLCLKPNS